MTTSANLPAGLLASVPSKTNPDLSYEIRRGKDGVVYCSCPAWKHQRLPVAHRSCKHLKSFHAANLAAKESVETKQEAGSGLAHAQERAAAAKRMYAANKALNAGGEAAKAAAQALLSDPQAPSTLKLRACAALVPGLKFSR